MPCLCHVKQHLICGVVIQLQPYNCVSEFRFCLNWISCIAPSLPCHACHLHHAGSSAVVVKLHPLCVPAFASSRIGSRSGVVRYDEFSGSSSAAFHRGAHLFPYFTVSVSLIYCYPYVAILLCHVSFPPVTHMSRVTLCYLSSVVCCLSLASGSASLGFCCYLDLLSGYVGLLGSCFTCYICCWR